jgi:hypothetical protein
MLSPALPTRICLSASWNQRSVAFSRICKDSLRLTGEQIATMQWVRERTSIPVPKILTYELDHSHELGAHVLLEKARSNTDLTSLLVV